MKKLSLSLVIGFFLFLLAPQFGTAQVISPDELTPAFLKKTFENAFVEVLEVEDTYIKIKDFHSFYLDIDAKKRFVIINVSYQLNPDAKTDDILNFINLINKDVALIKAYTSEDLSTITYDYYFWTNGGFTQKSLVSTIGLFKAALELCIEKDTKGVL